jgi:hypothetical protein
MCFGRYCTDDKFDVFLSRLCCSKIESTH